MEPNQEHFTAAAVAGHAQQVVHRVEPRFTGEIVSDVAERDWINRIDDDVAVVHRVTAAHLYVRTQPDANCAPDSSAPDALPKPLREQHVATMSASMPRDQASTFLAVSRSSP